MLYIRTQTTCISRYNLYYKWINFAKENIFNYVGMADSLTPSGGDFILSFILPACRSVIKTKNFPQISLSDGLKFCIHVCVNQIPMRNIIMGWIVTYYSFNIAIVTLMMELKGVRR